MEAAKHYAEHLERQKSKTVQVKFSVVVQEFLGAIEANGRSSRYVEDCTSRLTRASKAFTGYIESIRSSDLDLWLTSIKATGRTRNNYRSSLCTLFAYARSQGYLVRSEKTEAEMVMKASDRGGGIGIYTPEQLSVMLEGIDQNFLLMLALGAFAGLRTAEIHRLDWHDIDLNGGNIIVAMHKAKTGQRRIVSILPPLRAWIEKHPEKSGPVTPRYAGDAALLRAFRAALNALKVETVHNGLRHSFASYRLAVVKSAEQVALEMGNSPRKLFTNYRELVTEAQAGRWFSVMPALPENIVLGEVTLSRKTGHEKLEFLKEMGFLGKQENRDEEKI